MVLPTIVLGFRQILKQQPLRSIFQECLLSCTAIAASPLPLKCRAALHRCRCCNYAAAQKSAQVSLLRRPLGNFIHLSHRSPSDILHPHQMICFTIKKSISQERLEKVNLKLLLMLHPKIEGLVEKCFLVLK